MTSKLYKLWIYPIYQSTCGYDQGYDGEKPWGYEGEIDGLTMETNIRELRDVNITFSGGSEKAVIQDALRYFKQRNMHGRLRWVNK